MAEIYHFVYSINLVYDMEYIPTWSLSDPIPNCRSEAILFQFWYDRASSPAVQLRVTPPALQPSETGVMMQFYCDPERSGPVKFRLTFNKPGFYYFVVSLANPVGGPVQNPPAFNVNVSPATTIISSTAPAANNGNSTSDDCAITILTTLLKEQQALLNKMDKKWNQCSGGEQSATQSGAAITTAPFSDNNNILLTFEIVCVCLGICLLLSLVMIITLMRQISQLKAQQVITVDKVSDEIQTRSVNNLEMSVPLENHHYNELH